jgi:hypothetical protein
MEDFVFNPPTGLRDMSIYPEDPGSEAAAREQFQGLLDQLKDYANSLKNIENVIAPTLVNSWVNYPGNMPAGYYKDSFGIVHIQGMVKSGAIGSTIFTLPVGYRPSAGFNVATASNGAYGEIAIDANGVVTATVGSNTWVSLMNIQFRSA